MIQLLTLVLPVVATLLAIVSGVVTYFLQQRTSKKVDAVHTDLLLNTAETVAASAHAREAFTEANHANLKIQAVQDQLTEGMGLPHQDVTARALRDAAQANLGATPDPAPSPPPAPSAKGI